MQNINIIGSKVSSRHFDFNCNTSEFVAEISMLQHGGINVLGQLYNDAYDTGFVMVSEKTGKEVEFTLCEVLRDSDHDVRFWSFKPTQRARHFNPALQNVTAIVLND